MKKLLCILLVLVSFSCKKPCKSNQEIVSEFIKREKEMIMKGASIMGFFLNLKDDADSVYCSGDTVFASCTTNSDIFSMWLI